MAVADGEAARDGDIWYRVATHPDQIKNGRAQHGAFKGAAISRPQDKNRPWHRELSGRLRSLAGSRQDVIEHAVKFCEQLTAAAPGQGTKRFVGLMYAPVEDLKQVYEDKVRTLVVYTPIKGGDQAHADLTFTGEQFPASKPELEKFYIWLSDLLQVLHNEGPAGRTQLEHFPDAVDKRPIAEKFADSIAAFLKRTG